MQAKVRSSSPPRPGSTGRIPSSCRRIETPYLLSGLTDAVESKNTRNEIVQLKMHDHGAFAAIGSPVAEDGHKINDVRREEFVSTHRLVEHDGVAVEVVLGHLQDIYRHLDSFDPTGKGGPKSRRKRTDDGDDDDEEGESLRERIEQYKMCRKIEPELPALTPLPPLSGTKRLPDNYMIDFNLSEDAVGRWLPESRQDASKKRKQHREKQLIETSFRRDHQLDASRMRWTQALDQKMRQGQDAIAARRDGVNNVKQNAMEGLDVDVVAEKWVVVYAMAAFLQSARTEVDFNRKGAEEKREIIKQREAEGKLKRMDTVHLQSIMMEENLRRVCEACEDEGVKGKMEMLARMFQARVRVRQHRESARCIFSCLSKWAPAAHVFLGCKHYARAVVYLQAWWRRKSKSLKEIREKLAKRWEKIERYGSSGYQQMNVPHTGHVEVTDNAKKMFFLENELRSRRFFILPRIYMWEEDSAKWQAQEAERKKAKKAGLKVNSDIRLAPSRPSYLPPGYLSTESPDKPCPEGCLGRDGDNEILIMIKACRSNPEGRGWKEIPQKKAQDKQKAQQVHGSTGSEEQSDMLAPARLFGEAAPEDLERWGVHPSAMPHIGYKPEGEECYP